MAIVAQLNPFSFFADSSGNGLDNGYIYIGEPNKDPRQYPVAVYYDAAYKIPAPSPLRTLSGYVYRNGSPSFLYVNGNYSVMVLDKTGRQVFFVDDFQLTGNSAAVSLDDLTNTSDPTKGISLITTAARLVPTIAALRMLPKAGGSLAATVQGYNARGDGGGGNYFLDPADSTSTDNGGTVIVAADGGRWKYCGDQDSSSIFGAFGDGVTSANVSLARYFASKVPIGGKIILRKGLYPVSGGSNLVGALNIDLSTVIAEPVTNTKRIGVRGEGQAQTLLMNSTPGAYALSLTGVPGVGSHYHAAVEGIGFGGVSGAHGFYAFDIAYAQFKDIGAWGISSGMRLDSVLSTDIENCMFSDSVLGINAQRGAGFSGINAVSVRKTVFRALSQLGISCAGPSVNFNVEGGSTEGCGTQGMASTGGMAFVSDGSEGGVGQHIKGHYFEANRGGADISFFNSGTLNVTHTIESCNFNRVSAAAFVTNNIRMGGGPMTLILIGCTFGSYNDYVDDVSRLNVAYGAGHQVICIGVKFSSPVAQGALRNVNPASPYIGNISSAGVANTLPAGWTCSKTGTGVYTITHNLNIPTTQLAIVATANASGNNSVMRVQIIDANSFGVVTQNSAATLTDAAFTFMLAPS